MQRCGAYIPLILLIFLGACAGGTVVEGNLTAAGGAALPNPAVNTNDLVAVPGCWNISTTYGGALPSGKQKLASTFAGPLPTTKWWSSAGWDYPNPGDPTTGKPFSMALYAQPISAMSGPGGLWVSYVSHDAVTADKTSYYYQMSTSPDLLVGASNLAATGTAVDSAGDWSMGLAWQGAGATLHTTLVKGSPYVYVDNLSSEALVQLTGASPQVYAKRGDTVGVTVSGNAYGLFAPPGCTWEADPNNLQFASTLCGKSYYAVAALPDDTNDTLAFFRQHAFAFVTDTHVGWQFDSNQSVLTTIFTDVVDVKESSLSPQPLMALFPHQWKHSSAALTPYTYASPRGILKVLDGNTFTTTVTFHGVLPALPAVASLDPTALATYFQDFNLSPNTITMADTYSSGVAMNKVAQLIPIAAEANNTTVRDGALAAVQTALTDWFSATDNNPPLFEYHPTWWTLVGYPASFGSDTQLNDHHFHWGYHIATAALVSLYNPLWGQDTGYGGMVKALVRDAANPLHTDPKFPFMRHFDVYEGHSWASGHGNFAAGNDQESSSEAINFAYGLIYWGEVTQNATIRDLGLYLYTTEANAVDEYWFDGNHTTFPADNPQTDYAVLWGAGAAYATWWTSQPEGLHGIEFLPFTGGSLYLGDDPNALQSNYQALVTQLGGPEGSHSNPDAWVDIIWNMQALYNPSTALSKFQAQANNYTPQAGESRAHTYQWLSTMAVLGAVDTTITANHTLAAVFNNQGTRTYVAYNTYCDHPRTVLWSDGTSQSVPPHTLLAAQNGNVIAQTLIGSNGCTVATPLDCKVVDTGLGQVH